MPIPEGLQLVKPWEVIHDTPEVQSRAERLSTELKRELPSEHVLFGIKATAIAHRIDQDDVLRTRRADATGSSALDLVKGNRSTLARNDALRKLGALGPRRDASRA